MTLTLYSNYPVLYVNSVSIAISDTSTSSLNEIEMYG